MIYDCTIMKKIIKGILKAIMMLLAILFLLTGLLFLTVSTGVFGPLPTRAELADIHNEEASLVFASDNTLIGKYFAENRTNISWDEVPEHLVNALVATEDKRFYLHEGYDSRSYLRVFFKTMKDYYIDPNKYRPAKEGGTLEGEFLLKDITPDAFLEKIRLGCENHKRLTSLNTWEIIANTLKGHNFSVDANNSTRNRHKLSRIFFSGRL